MKNVFMETQKDILKDSKLKEQVFTVPEGYFETLKSQLKEKREQTGKTSLAGRLVPYLAIAASFALIAVVGSAILKRTVVPSEEQSFETFYNSQLISEQISDSEIVDYLLYSGISAEGITNLME